MSSEPLYIFDPRRNLQLQGFTGRGATTTLHDATETGVTISGQAAGDFAVLCWWNAYDYFNHLRLKHLPKTDLSGLTLDFDIEYDHVLDGAMRFDAAKYPTLGRRFSGETRTRCFWAAPAVTAALSYLWRTRWCPIRCPRRKRYPMSRGCSRGSTARLAP